MPDLQASFPADTTAGDLIVVAVSWDTSRGAQPRVSDSQENSYSLATNGNNTTFQQGLAIFYAANVKGGADTVTLSVSVAASYLRLNIQEYTGVATTNPVDGTAQNIDTKGTSAAGGVTSGSAVTTQSGDLIFGAVMGDSGTNTTVTAGTGATQRVVGHNGADDPLASEDLIQTSAGSVAATFTFSIAGSYQTHMVAFRPGVAGGTPPPAVAPSIDSATSASGQVGSAFKYQITATNNPTSFDATGLPAGLSINTATGLISGTPTIAGTSSIALSASNASGTGTASLTLTIAAGSSGSGGSSSGSSSTYLQGVSAWNDGYLSSLRASFPANTTAGDLIVVAVSWDTSGGAQPSVSDSQGNSYSMATNGNNTALQQGLAIFYAPKVKGGADTVSLGVSVSASYLRLNIQEYTGVATTNPVDGTAQNIDPKGTSAPNGVTSGNGVTTLSGDLIFGAVMGDSGNNTTITAGSGATQRVVADNGAVDPLASEDLIQTSAGSAAATFTFSVAGSYQAQMVAFKPAAGGTPPPPAVPAINSATSASGQVGSAFSYQITATNNPTSFDATGLPAGLSINRTTGLISGTPTAAGTASIGLSATNASGTGTATLSLSIASGTPPPPAIPEINSATSATGQVGNAFSYQITATNNPTSFNAKGLPAGLSINTTTGRISGTPTAAGTSSIGLSATNASGTGSATLSLTITGAQSSQIQTVFLILMENQNWSGIAGNASAPYINRQLLPIASHAEQYYNPPGVHPSLPNYLWLEAGTNFGITDDNDPSSHSENTTQHLVTQLTLAGKTWKAYQEDIPGTNCPLTDVNDYAVHHDPFVYFTDVTNNNNSNSQTCIAHVRPYSELAADLQNNKVANYNFITPNMCDDMHDCGVSAGDSWLSTEIPKIMNSAAYRNGGAIFITWDEGENDSDGPIGMIVISPLAKGNGYSNSIRYTHSSTLLTLEETFGLSVRLGASASATDLSDLFK